MISLRPYQLDAISLLRNGFAQHKRQILCLPTGSGKTVVFSNIIELAAEKGTQTLVLTHRTELFKSTWNSIDRLGIEIQSINADTKVFDSNSIVTIAMVETISRRLKKLNGYNPKLIIIDEAHFENFTKIIEYFTDALVIGVTATPVGKHFYKYYTGIVSNIDIPDLVKQGFLCDYIGWQMQDNFDNIGKSKGDYINSELFQHFNKKQLYNGVVDKYIEKCNGQKAIVFNCNMEHSENMAKAFRDVGIEAYSITSDTDKKVRDQLLDNFSKGVFKVLCNCAILTTGYDEPSIEVVIVNRATMSLPLWLQMCGRGSRIYPNKKQFTVLDFGMNHERHGMWNDEREWKIEPPKEKKAGSKPVKECKCCGSMLNANTKKCPHCEYVFPEKEKGLEEGELVMVTKKINKRISQLTIEELIELQKQKRLKATFVHRVIRSKGHEVLQEYAYRMNYAFGWVRHQMNNFDNRYKDFVIK